MQLPSGANAATGALDFRHDRHYGVRFIVGLTLTDLGLRYWEQHNLGPQLREAVRGVRWRVAKSTSQF